MSAAGDILRKGLELLGPNGEHWGRGQLYGTDSTGNQFYCAVGAIRQAVWVCNRMAGGPEHCQAHSALQSATGHYTIPYWNDSRDTTFDDVKRAFQMAAVMADEGLDAEVE